jgi:hypothetical protein
MRVVRAWLGGAFAVMAVAACSLANKAGDPLPESSFAIVPGAEPSCPEGTDVCGKACVNLKSNRQNCGACGTACAAEKDCVLGKCQVSCGGTSVRCGDKCFDVKGDPLNCGECDKACPTGANTVSLCAAGTCQVTCKAPFKDCDGKPETGCENDVSASKTDCGTCGNACPATAPNAAPVCTAGNCNPNCNVGFSDCDAKAVNGCECPQMAPNATPGCAGGACALNCTPGFADCDNDLTNGCEVDLTKDLKNCGKCATACDPQSEVCAPNPPMSNPPAACQKGLAIQVEGHADVIVTCAKGDYSCQAKQICEKITKVPCVYQDYTCCGPALGSWYPQDGMSGSSNFNFTYNYDFCPGNPNYGNICACTLSQMQKYGLAANHQGCGYGHWTRQ